MKLVLRAIRWVEEDVCEVDFFHEDRGPVEAVFRLTRRGGRVGVTVTPDVFGDFFGKAAQARATVHAVKTFCLAAQGELET
ncbi:MAG: hypothetical protein ACRBI6_21845 [Acidimicrobiales bacterium]